MGWFNQTQVIMEFNIGDKVVYVKTNEKGIVKQVNQDTCHVVYNCNNDWDNYAYYTGQLTKKEDLTHNWEQNGKDKGSR